MRFLQPFLVAIVMYHLIVTLVWYGIAWWAYPEIPALTRDALWILFLGCVAIAHVKSIKSYLLLRKRQRIALIVLVIFSVSMSIYKDKSIYDMVVGIKYGFLYLFIFFSATFVGHIYSQKANGTKSMTRFVQFLKYLLIGTLVGWFLRQWLKFIRPDIFLHIGYGPFNDFKFGSKPPIYYLTGYQWTPRRQWFFAWPNNYGYFLIAFLPALIYLCKQRAKDITQTIKTHKYTLLNIVCIAVWIGAIILTLSRTAFIWGAIGLAMINIQRIRQHKKLSRGIGIAMVAGLVGLSVLKWASTLGHIQAKFGSIAYVIQQPSGYGLGTSWPAVHHNGTILPENYYIQLMLDIGTIGFLLRAVVIGQILRIIQKIKKQSRTTYADIHHLYQTRNSLSIGRVALLVMGIFLHVFEDSMINYLFFVTRGILTGYLVAYTQKTSNEKQQY